MDAAVVDDGGLDDVVAAGLQEPRDGVSEKVIADMPEMKGLVGVGRAELDHHVLPGGGKVAEIRGGDDLREKLVPVEVGEKNIQESFHAVEPADLRHVGHEPIAYRLAGVLGGGVGHL